MKKIILSLLLCAAWSLAYAHEHHDAPHKGLLIELGDEFGTVELLLDQASGHLSAYILDGEVEESVRLKQKYLDLTLKAGPKPLHLRLKAQANPLTGESLGDSSEFGVDSKWLKGREHFEGQIDLIHFHDRVFRNIAFKYPETGEGSDAQEKK
jgi:hypothetical protein